MKDLNAWYSKKMDERWGHVVYRRANGEEVKCCSVSAGDEHCMGWDDVEYVGKVTEFVANKQVPHDHR